VKYLVLLNLIGCESALLFFLFGIFAFLCPADFGKNLNHDAIKRYKQNKNTISLLASITSVLQTVTSLFSQDTVWKWVGFAGNILTVLYSLWQLEKCQENAK